MYELNGEIKFIDIPAVELSLKEDILKHIGNIIERGDFVQGAEVKEFENWMKKYLGVEYAVGVNSGTDALVLALDSLGVSKGDEVITTPFTYWATTQSILRNGAIPVFVDVDESGNLDPQKIQLAITEKTKAILPVHIFGKPADMPSIMDIAKENELMVIEDCTQAIGSKIGGQKVGTFGDVACFSFYPTKNLGADGDGGMIISNNQEIEKKIRILQNNGASEAYMHTEIGGNSRLDSLQAAVLNVKSKMLDIWNEMRIKNAQQYREGLSDLEKSEKITLPKIKDDEIHTFHQFTLKVAQRDELRSFLSERGIPTALYYKTLINEQPVFNIKNLSCRISGDIKKAKELTTSVLSLPVAPHLSEKQIQYIIQSISDFYRKNNG
jgi:dTDP-4-amino-4,6-dideoxygalactose transaminase